MPRKRDRIERSSRMRALLEDPWRKLASLGLAVLLWLYLDSQVSQSDSLLVKLRHDAPSADLRNVRDAFVSLRVDTERFTLLGFENVDEPGATIEEVTLELSGARRAMAEFLASPAFVVRVAPTADDAPPAIEFGADDVKPLDPRHANLVVGMSPSRVRARLAANIERNIALDANKVEVVAPDVPGFLDRLQWDDVAFEPASVKVRGPDHIVHEFERGERRPFLFDPKAPPADAQALSESLKLAPWAAGVRLEPEAVVMRITLRAPTKNVVLPAVRVELVGAQRENYRLEKDRVDVPISAYDRLWNTLPTQPADLREWIDQNCVIVAQLPQDPSVEGTIEDQKLVFWRSEIRESDWRMTGAPTIRYVQKPKNP